VLLLLLNTTAVIAVYLLPCAEWRFS